MAKYDEWAANVHYQRYVGEMQRMAMRGSKWAGAKRGGRGITIPAVSPASATSKVISSGAPLIKWDQSSIRGVAGKMERLALNYPNAARMTAAQVAMQALNDTVMEQPTVPLRDGYLRSTANHEVHGAGSSSIVSIWYGYNTEYAAVMHEGRWATGPLAGVVIQNWSEPGSGPGFILHKLQRHRREYITVWSQKIRRVMGM